MWLDCVIFFTENCLWQLKYLLWHISKHLVVALVMKASLVHSNMTRFRTPYCATRTKRKLHLQSSALAWPHKEHGKISPFLFALSSIWLNPLHFKICFHFYLFYFGSSLFWYRHQSCPKEALVKTIFNQHQDGSFRVINTPLF